MSKECYKDLESFWIRYLKFLGKKVLNKNEGGGGPSFYTEEQKQKISKSKIGQKYPKEHGEKLSQVLKGKPKPKGFSEKISQIKKGKGVKPVLQYDLEGNFIKEWPSIKEAASYYKLDEGTLSNCCNNKKVKTCGGFKWSFV
jgi:hypothetical protein